MSDKTLIQSYVQNKWFVSTILREASVAIIPAPWFYETIVWLWDVKKEKVRGDIIHMNGGATAANLALITHAEICRKLVANESLGDDK